MTPKPFDLEAAKQELADALYSNELKTLCRTLIVALEAEREEHATAIVETAKAQREADAKICEASCEGYDEEGYMALTECALAIRSAPLVGEKE